MADAKKEAALEAGKAAEGDAKKKNKAPILFGGGAIGMVALGYILSMMAVPSRPAPRPELEGPFVAGLSKSDIQVNLSGDSSKRYLVMKLQAQYFAYEESYVAGRLGIASGHGGGGHGDAPVEDPNYTMQLKDALLKLGSTKTLRDVTEAISIDNFLNDVREVVDPILFPIYVGDSHSPQEGDKTSGIKVGDSSSDSNFRGFLHEHELEVDNLRKKVRLDDGDWVEYEGHERDLVVETRSKTEKAYVNLTELKSDFCGKVPFGVPGRVRTIYRESLLVQ
jgi:hypothetical protein